MTRPGDVGSLILRRAPRSALVGLLLAAMFLLAFDSLRRESLTVDEPLHLTAGYASWAFGDHRLQESNGELPQRWFAIPLLFSGTRFPARTDASWQQPGYLGLQVCDEFLFHSGNNPDSMILHGRLMAVVAALLLALAVYAWTARLFGSAAGLLACFLCALDPTVLAHGHLMTSDVTAALFFFLSVGCFWSLFRRFTYLRLAASTACFGLLMVSKMSGALAVPMALLMLLSRMALGRPWPVRLGGFRLRRVISPTGKAMLGALAGLAHLLGALAIIWSFYGWQFKPSVDWQPGRDSYSEPREAVFGSLGASRAAFSAAEEWRILPDAYLYGLAHTLEHSERRPAFLNGSYSKTGWWYYFPYCFAVKTPLPLLALVGLGAGALAARSARRAARLRRAAFLALLDRTSIIWSLLLVYGAAALFTNLNIGQRHLLPLYPPLFMLAGAAASGLRTRRRWPLVVIGALMLLQVALVARIHPHYLAYFNELAGGPSKGYLHLSDSNVDWGQDLPSLARWLREHPEIANEGQLYFSNFSFEAPQRWGIQARPLPDVSNPRLSSADPVTCQSGTFCFSATQLILPGLGRPPWDAGLERTYRDQLTRFRELEETHPLNPADAGNVQIWQSFVQNLAQLQSERLRSYLIARKPDAMVGYSILIFRLSDAELRAALVP
jgi:4-amino-4-deoxy-L-arabinose transferase-like glycosyltransferase